MQQEGKQPVSKAIKRLGFRDTYLKSLVNVFGDLYETTCVSCNCIHCERIQCVETYRSFIANATLHHVLVDLSLHRDQALTHPAADHRSTATLWGGERGVGRRVLPQEHRGLSGAGERREACTGMGEK